MKIGEYLLIAELNVYTEFIYDTMISRAKRFIIKPVKPDICLKSDEQMIKKLNCKHINIDAKQCEVILTAQDFFAKGLEFGKLLIHASVIKKENEAYIFLANPSGGKTTHCNLWKKTFGDEVIIISDDNPIIGMKNNKAVVWHSPWSKYTEVDNCFKETKICALIFLKQSVNLKCRKLDFNEAKKMFLLQYPEKMRKISVDDLLKNFICIEAFCDLSINSVKMVYNIIKNTC